jgi:hypothetical protein
MSFTYFKVATPQDVARVSDVEINVGDYIKADMYDDMHDIVDIDNINKRPVVDPYKYVTKDNSVDMYDMSNPCDIVYGLPINGISLEDSNIGESRIMRASMAHVCEHHYFTDSNYNSTNYAHYRNCSSGFEAAYNIACYEINQTKLKELEKVGFKQFFKKM